MIREHGDMWSIYDSTNYFIVTTNSYIRSDGALVMGRGIAKQFAERFPKAPYEIAIGIEHLGVYGLRIRDPEEPGSPFLACFQVKRHYKDDAELPLIRYSAKELDLLATVMSHQRIDMNFPGIGYGRLSYNEVLPYIETLPDNVHIWTYT